MAETTVYFIQCDGPLGPVKIGHARDVDRRLSSLQMGCPYQLRLIGRAVVADGPAVEAQLHQRFHAAAMRGEWFAGVPEILDLARRCVDLHAVRVSAILAGGEMPPPPPELALLPHGEVAGQAVLDVAQDVARHIRRIRKEAAVTHLGHIDKRRGSLLERVAKPRRKAGEFMWRGRVRG